MGNRRNRQSPDRINPGHQSIRIVLRVVGPLLIVAGAYLFYDVIASFHAGFDQRTSIIDVENGTFRLPGEKKDEGLKMGQAVVAMICFFLGATAARFGYQGALARYSAAEYAPVVSDTANYVAHGAKEGIREISSAIAEGIRGGGAECPNCGTENDSDAKFCDSCGTAMSSEVECNSCGEENDADAKFCKSCGRPLSNS